MVMVWLPEEDSGLMGVGEHDEEMGDLVADIGEVGGAIEGIGDLELDIGEPRLAALESDLLGAVDGGGDGGG